MIFCWKVDTVLHKTKPTFGRSLNCIRSVLQSLNTYRSPDVVVTSGSVIQWKCRDTNHRSYLCTNTGKICTRTDDPVVLYRWPTMRHFRFISRLKIYQLTFMLALLPPMSHWYYTEQLTAKSFGYGCLASLGTIAVLAIISHYFGRVVGELQYVNLDKSVRISTLTFWGGRRELEFPVDSVIEFVVSQTRMGGAVQRLQFKGQGDVFLWSFRYGHVLNLDLLCKVLKISSNDLSHF